MCFLVEVDVLIPGLDTLTTMDVKICQIMLLPCEIAARCVTKTILDPCSLVKTTRCSSIRDRKRLAKKKLLAFKRNIGSFHFLLISTVPLSIGNR
jgi:hypothetical protein